MLNRLLTIGVTAVLFAFAPTETRAAITQAQAFPACTTPQGTIISQYSSGTHGIAGSTATYEGSDTVYRIDGEKIVQCFCPQDGSGIQTNWLKASGFSESQIQEYKDAGWIFIQNGLNWGLDDSPFLAYNMTYSCGNGGTGGSSGSSSSSSDSAGSASAVKDVLGLASTGDGILLYVLGFLGISFLLLGLKFRKTE